jgi:hypothetical protein
MKLPTMFINTPGPIRKWRYILVAALSLSLFLGFMFVSEAEAEVSPLLQGGQITLSGVVGDTQIYPLGNSYMLISKESKDKETDLLLEKLTAKGQREWSLPLAQPGEEKLELMQMVGNDIVIILSTSGKAGFSYRMLRLDGTGKIIWQRNLPLKKVSTMNTTNDDGLIVIGVKSSGIGRNSLVALKMDNKGSWNAVADDVSRWEVTLGNENYCQIYDIKQVLDQNDYNDGYIIAGYKQMGGQNQKDAMLIKLDTYGRLCWQHTYSRAGNDEAFSVTPLRDENKNLTGYALTGYCTRINGQEMYLLHTGTTGSLNRWPGIDRAIDGDAVKFYGRGYETVGVGVYPVPKSFEGSRTIGKESFDGDAGVLLVGLQTIETEKKLLVVRISEKGRDKWESRQDIPGETLIMGEANQASTVQLNVVYSSSVPDDLQEPITVNLLKLYMQNVSENDKTKSQTEVYTQKTEDMLWETVTLTYETPEDKAGRTEDIKKLLARQSVPALVSPRSGRGEINWPDTSYYLGNLVIGKADGEGTLLFPNGVWYKGAWKNNMFNGKGYLRFPTGEYYQGEFKDHMMQGKGIMSWPTGEKYEGEFLNNQRDGQGKLTWKNGTFYEGGFKEGQASGMGLIRWPNGERYEGQMTGGNATGQGSYYFPSGEWYRGEIANLAFEGVGVYHWPDGSYYVGEFKQDRLNGEGYYVWPNGVQQWGYWKDDRYLGTNPDAVKTRENW